MESEIFTPAEFMRPLGGDQALGNIYEMRTYTYQPGTMGEVLKRWTAAIPHREEYSPLAAGMSSELGGLNKWMHVWPYKDLEERNKIRAEASTNPNWPPPTRGVFGQARKQDLRPGILLTHALSCPSGEKILLAVKWGAGRPPHFTTQSSTT